MYPVRRVKKSCRRQEKKETDKMFTGIVEEVGTVEKIIHSSQSCTLAIRCKKVLEGTAQGDSIAVNGACLTVTQLTGKSGESTAPL